MPRPVLQAMVLADHVYQDRLTGKFVIAGTFSSVWIGEIKFEASTVEGEAAQRVASTQPPTQIGSPYLYLALVEVIGQVPLILKLVDLSDASVLFEVQVVVMSTDPLLVAEYVIPMPLLPVHKAASYSLDLLFEGEILGSWRIVTKKIEGQTEGAGGIQ